MTNYQLESRLQVLIPDVQNFLKRLDASKIPKAQQKDREDLLKRVDNLVKDFPDKFRADDDDVGSVHSRKSDEVYDDEVYELFDEKDAKPSAVERKASLPVINDVAVGSVLRGCLISGYLTRKNPSKSKFDIQSFVNKFFGKKFCVVKQGVLYIFDKNSSKKHDLEIILKGYDVRNIYDKKESIFELVSPGKPTYMFSAPSEGERTLWCDILEKEVFVTADTRSALLAFEETYESTDENSEIIDEIYDDIGEIPANVSNKNKGNLLSNFNKNIEKNKAPVPDDHIQEIYEDDVSSVPAKSDVKANKQVEKTKISEGEVNEVGCRFESLFYGLWDCGADAADELPFKQGQIIEILGKDYEKFGWWVGRLDGRVGIVPKEYLSPAFRMVAA